MEEYVSFASGILRQLEVIDKIDGREASYIVKRIVELKRIIDQREGMNCSDSFMIIMLRALVNSDALKPFFDENMKPEDRNSFYKMLETFFNLKTNEDIYTIFSCGSKVDNQNKQHRS